MSKPTAHKKHDMSNSKITDYLRTVPYDKGFHFFTTIGHYSGESAISLNRFALKLQVIAADSVKFHFQRNDFQKWIKDTIRDDELAKRISRINRQLPIKNLQKDLIGIAQTRIAELSQSLPHHMRHHHL